jgi:uncharacterized membrane protein
MDGFGGVHGGIGMIVGGLFFLALGVLLILLIVALVRKSHGGPHHGPHGFYGPHGPRNPEEFNPGKPGEETADGSARPDSSVQAALGILNERYAKGEIGQEEYLAKKSDLLK